MEVEQELSESYSEIQGGLTFVTKRKGLTRMYDVIQDTIVSRRTVRKFQPEDIPMHTVMTILEDAKWAPNHKFREPWEIILYKGEGRELLVEHVWKSLERKGLDEEKLDKKKKKFERFVNEIPIHLLIYIKSPSSEKVRHEDFAATCAFIQNVQLLSWAKGLGTVWKTNEFIFDPDFRESVGIERDDVVIGMLHLGKPDVIPEPRERKSISDKLTIKDTKD